MASSIVQFLSLRRLAMFLLCFANVVVRECPHSYDVICPRVRPSVRLEGYFPFICGFRCVVWCVPARTVPPPITRRLVCVVPPPFGSHVVARCLKRILGDQATGCPEQLHSPACPGHTTLPLLIYFVL